VLFSRTSKTEIGKALRQILDWSDEKLVAGSEESRRLAQKFGPERWSQTFNKLLSDLGYRM
jgi:hypothetical protein